MRVRITLDTNVFNLVADPAGYPESAGIPLGTGERLRAAISASEIQAFVSEASFFVECLSFADKLEYLSLAGTADQRPIPDPRGIAIFETLARLGVRMLHAPLIGAEIFFEDMVWADDEIFSAEERHNRFSSFGRQYPRHKPLVILGNDLLKNQPPPPPNRRWKTPSGFRQELRQEWAIALKREWDQGNEAARKSLKKKVAPLISEWCDVLIVASHFAYGNDIFCTLDQGRAAGVSSILHSSNRAALLQKGIRIASPQDVVLS
jgi:hypothetical protein